MDPWDGRFCIVCAHGLGIGVTDGDGVRPLYLKLLFLGPDPSSLSFPFFSRGSSLAPPGDQRHGSCQF